MKVIKSTLTYFLILCLLLWPVIKTKADEDNRSSDTFVLVHGASGGGWDWRTMDTILSGRGHKVHRVTLTGLGERAHLSSPKIDLTTHINDVTNTVIFDQLDDIILVGHSYGGMVITGVINSIPTKIKHAIFLDAAVPNHGSSFRDLWPSERGLDIKDGIVYFPWLIENSKPPHDVPQSLATLNEKVSYNDELALKVPATYIPFVNDAAEQKLREKADLSWNNARARGWPIRILESDHNAQRSHPRELADLLEHVIFRSAN
mgnify:FL=1